MTDSKRRIKVLHATMSLDIGGAETHIVELAKNLNDERFEVIVASNGGVYEKELTDHGIRHFRVPLYTKNPFKVIKSYYLLKRLIKEERIDIIHAHARIPAFICGLIGKKLNKQIVTTTHFNFKVNWLFRKISNWGHKSIAVSEDLKAYLKEEYDYKEEDVYLSVNGIDCEKFKPSEQHRQENEPLNILHVSRLDQQTSEVCRYLIRMAPELYEKNPNIRIKVAGSGTQFEELKRKADKANKAIGVTVLELLGPISDVPKFLDTGDVFVGISRSVLEAMNYSMPTVLAGDYGMKGYLEPSMLKACEGHNFTCRGEAALDYGVFKKELNKALGAIGKDHKWMRSYILDHYSVAKMTEPYRHVYEDLIHEPKKYVIAGYYGYSNSGDDALLSATCRDIHHNNPANKTIILTNEPIDKESHFDAESLYRFSLLKVVKAIKDSDFLIMGGGSLLQDKTSNRSIWYYLGLIVLANHYKKRCFLYANGIGPINHKYNAWLTKKIINQIDVITLRESKSRETLEELGIDQPYIKVTADPVFSLPFNQDADVQSMLVQSGLPSNEPYCVAIFRSWVDDDAYVTKVAAICDYVKEKYGLNILFVPMKHPQDIVVENRIREHMTYISYLLEEKCDVHQVMSVIEKADLVLSMRLHGILYSAIKNVPVVGFSYDVKIDYYTQALDMHLVEDILDIDVKEVKRSIDDTMDNYEKMKETLEIKLHEQQEKSLENAKILRDLI